MNFWILSIDSLMTTFSTTESKYSINYKMKLNSTIEHGNILNGKNIYPKDKILGYLNKPIGEIRFVFEVIEVKDGHLVLQKIYETKYGVNLSTLEQIDKETYDLLESNDQYQLQNLSENTYHALFNALFNKVKSIDSSPQEIREKPEGYTVPQRDPKQDSLPHNWIVFGAPGTGKSYEIDQQRFDYFGTNYERVTFHPNFSYGQFVGAYKPRPQKGDKSTITYELVPGPLLRMLTKAMNAKAQNFVLVVEEINRANTAAVFGDIFQLLDRNEEGRSEYSIVASEEVKDYIEQETGTALQNYELRLPSNLYIWATMNTSDQGVFPLDSAFKRRFDFEYIGINSSEEKIDEIDITVNGIGTLNWNHFRRTLNDYLLNNVRNMKDDKLVGPFFIKKTDLEGSERHFQRVFQNKLLMYLAEDILKTDKTKLFKYRSFSHIMNEYVEGNNVFTEEFTNFLLEQG
ncbi:McrB family protein [Pontibacillus sp. HMF3514]|uniref:McrB family protein n=1 Tax=Pontibacillus sp. HMF3514 TaxID=2692425 RepID=UPI0013205014|nr:AAA family ATPase [Pontibacillus sp. HMF3514]QHE51686.1 AAA domain-containing protein [Pontibacillus sp. HMF3514]